VTGGRADDVRVRIPTPLRSYTGGESEVCAAGTTLRQLLDDLDRRYPGVAFRVVDEQGRLRPHMVVWLRGERCRDLDTRIDHLGRHDEVVLMQALSGG
jgi:sulfur-carrier protein